MKTWQKPQLIVLVRSNPEETLTIACKAATFGTTPTNVWSGCAALAGGPCMNCDLTTPS